jgi:spore coat protein H
MYRIFSATLLLTTLLTTLCTALTINGIIVDSETSSPIAGAVVTLSNSDKITRTDDKGEFDFEIGQTTSYSPTSKTVDFTLNYSQGKTIKVTGGIGKAKFSIYNLQGRQIINKDLTLGSVSEIEYLPKGIYVYKLKTASSVVLSGKLRLSNSVSNFNLGSAQGEVLSPKVELSENIEINILSRTHHSRTILVDSLISDKITVKLKEDETAELFNDTIMRSYNLIVDQQTLSDMETFWEMEEYQKAKLTVDDTELGDVGVRYKGAYGLKICFDDNNKKICPKVSLKFKINKYNPNNRLMGVKRINLHSLNEDLTKMHDKIGYEQFHDMGIYASRTAFAKLYVNGEFQGVYLAIEQVDEVFAESRFSEYKDGNLFKSVWPGHSNDTKLLQNLKTNEFTQNLDGFKEFGELIGNGNFYSDLDSLLDISYMMRYIAVDRAIINWDGIMTWYYSSSEQHSSNHNFYWYENNYPNKRFTLIPWDLDECLVRPGYVHEQCNVPTWTEGEDSKVYPFWLDDSLTVPGNDPFIRGLANTHFDKYVKFSKDILDYGFNEDTLVNRVTRYSNLIKKSLQYDPNLKTPYSEWLNAVKAFKESVPYYRRRLEKLIENFTPDIPDPVDSVTSLVVNGISSEVVNGFESETQENLESWLSGKVTSPSKTHPYINKVNPMSGKQDLCLQTIFKYSKEESWLSSYYKLPIIDAPIDLSEYRFLSLQLRCDFFRPISVNFEGDGSAGGYLNLPGKSYMIFNDPVEIIVDLETLYYEGWEDFSRPVEKVIAKTRAVSFEVDLNYSVYEYPIDKIDTCNIYIDNIRFVK